MRVSLALIAPLVVAYASAANLVDWTFTGLASPAYQSTSTSVSPGSTIAASTYATTASGLTAGAIVSGAGTIFTRRIEWSSANALASGELNMQNWDLTGAAGSAGTTGSTGDSTPDNWLQFSVTAGPGSAFEITGISMSAWRNGSGAPEFYKWGVSADGGSSWSDFGSQYVENNQGDLVFRPSTYSSSVSIGAGSTVLLRFAPTGGSGNIHINDIVVTGTVVDPNYQPPGPVTISPPAGLIHAGDSVSLSATPAGAEIRYTLDGSDPVKTSPLYSAPVVRATSGEIRARASVGDVAGPIAFAHHAIVPVSPPNILVVVGEDIGSGDLSCFGSVTVSTPYLDSLAWAGTRFSGALTTGPGASSSPYAILTGRVPRRAGLAETVAANQVGWDSREWTLAEAVRKKGYSTAFIGGWQLGSAPGSMPRDQGFQHFYGLPWSNKISPAPPLKDDDVLVNANPDSASLLEGLTSRAESYLTASAASPFFLVFHPPALPASGGALLGPTGNRIEAFDASVGRLLTRLDQLGLSNNTLVLFISSTTAARSALGPSLGSNGLFRDGAGTTWEGGVRIPAIARWPGVIPPTVQSIANLSLPDVFFSLVKITNAWTPTDRPYDGAPHPEILLGVRSGVTDDIVVHQDRRNGQDFAIQTTRRGLWKLHLAYQKSDPENNFTAAAPLLFHVGVDPSERINRVSSESSLVTILQQAAATREATFAAAVPQLPVARPPFIGTPTSQTIGSGFHFSFTRPPDSLDDHYFVEFSTDLVSWEPESISSYPPTITANVDGPESVDLAVPPVGSPLPRYFARLRSIRP